MASNRLPVVPTVTVLAQIKVRLLAATKGHALLKKKADALTVRFRAILKEIIEAKQTMGESLRDSFFSLIEAKYAAGDKMKHTILDNVSQANVRVTAHTENVAGVKIPKFEQNQTTSTSKMDLTGLGAGGQQIQNCRKSFSSTIELLVELANLQTAFRTLDEALKVTNRRVNALENVVKPKLENTISYIKVYLFSGSFRRCGTGRAGRVGKGGVLQTQKSSEQKGKGAKSKTESESEIPTRKYTL